MRERFRKNVSEKFMYILEQNKVLAPHIHRNGKYPTLKLKPFSREKKKTDTTIAFSLKNGVENMKLNLFS